MALADATSERILAMAFDGDEHEAPRPKRKRPAPDQGEGVAPGGADEGYSTFRPTPVGSARPENPKRASRRP